MKTKYIKPASTIYQIDISHHILAGSSLTSTSNGVNLGNGGNATTSTTIADSRDNSIFDDDANDE